MPDIPMIETPRLRMPKLGLGTWPLAGAEGQAAVESALAMGYRHIDTAEMYGNEEVVGAGIAAGGVPRGELFVTTKVWYDRLHSGDAIRAACEASLARLGLDHVDLYLIHWPGPEMDLPGALRAMDRIRQDGPPLRGIIHSAGVVHDAGFLSQDAETVAAVFAPKVTGATLLDRLTRGDALDFFVLFSSVAGVLGSSGQANHAGANAFLDLLAARRRAEGLPGLSVAWGPWSEVGAAADRGMAERLAALGLGAVTPEQGLQALDRALSDDLVQVVVQPADWRRVLSREPRRATLLSELTEQRACPACPVPSGHGGHNA